MTADDQKPEQTPPPGLTPGSTPGSNQGQKSAPLNSVDTGGRDKGAHEALGETKLAQNPAGQNEASQDKAGQNEAGQNAAGQDAAGQDAAGRVAAGKATGPASPPKSPQALPKDARPWTGRPSLRQAAGATTASKSMDAPQPPSTGDAKPNPAAKNAAISTLRTSEYRGQDRLTARARVFLAVLVGLALAVMWFTNQFLTERFTTSTRTRAEVRQALYTGNLISELQRNSIVPLLLSRDPTLIGGLNSRNYTQTSQHLISFVDEIGAAGIVLLDDVGTVVAATDRAQIGESRGHQAYFLETLRSNETLFHATRTETASTQFTYARKIDFGGALAGVIVVSVDLGKFEKTWIGISDAVIVTDSEGVVILSSEPRWRGQLERDALAIRSAPTAIERALRATSDWTVVPPDAYLRGEAVMRMETLVPFNGWRMISFTTFESVRERVNTVLALEIMGFAMLLALGFYLTSRRALVRAGLFARESAELRQLNIALQREIAERQKAEKSLQVAEQTLLQSSKLAALGEMSASVSHELNQPLAAMRTYLAGARLLLQRKRPDEALASFQRIDDLIDRMAAITRQLKSFARKGGDAFAPMELRDSVSAALSMMEPQLKLREIEIVRSQPRKRIMAIGDHLRLEQVLVNLLRNALDATKNQPDPKIEIVVAEGENHTILVRDNGDGIKDLEAMFEPFYTTKSPGDGVGLGLAISSGIIADLGGRLVARNGVNGGAVFEISLPAMPAASETRKVIER